MEAENSCGTQCSAKHRPFGSKNRLSDELWAGSEVANYAIRTENAYSGNTSDDSTASKECIPTRSSWPPEDDYTCFNNSYRRLFHDNIRQTYSQAHGNIRDQLFESGLRSPETLEYQLARLTVQYHELSESYTDSIIRLRQAEADVDAVMKQNLQLQASYIELAKLAGMTTNGLFIQALHNPPVPVEPAPYSVNPPLPSLSSIYNDPLFNSTPSKVVETSSSLHTRQFPASHSNGLEECGDVQQARRRHVHITKKNITTDVVAENSPKSVLSFGFQNTSGNNPKLAPASSNLDRVAHDKPSARIPALPKSISIRSPGFLTVKEGVKKCKPAPACNSPSQPHRLRLVASTPPDIIPVSVPVGGDVDEEVEYEVYNQGMWKTELCNKWQDTGACPYGDRCQFAHGIDELRPVIRHPRYKTELCRMVAAGDKCPYGHRCHFRHVLTDEEKETLK